MTSLIEFAAALYEVRARFTANLEKITRLLGSTEVGFMLVTTPSADVTAETHHFVTDLKSREFRFDGVALNRTLGYLSVDRSTDPASEVLQFLQDRERRVGEALAAEKIPVCARLPELARDVHSLEDLAHVALAMGSADTRNSSERGKSLRS